MKLQVKTMGAAPSEIMEFDAKQIADALQYECSGSKSTENRAAQVTQEFVNKHNITATYASGSFLGFKIEDSALDEFETFKK